MQALMVSTGVVALAEIGDKTQVAKLAMAAHDMQPVLAVIGTTLGMLVADLPAVFVGDRLAGRKPMKLVHGSAAAVFAALGLATLLGASRARLARRGKAGSISDFGLRCLPC